MTPSQSEQLDFKLKGRHMIHLDDDDKDFLRESAFVAFVFLCLLILGSIAIVALGMLVDYLLK